MTVLLHALHAQDPATEIGAPPHRMDFREFMLRQCDAGACPETCVAAFKTYCQEFAQRQFAVASCCATAKFAELLH